MVAQQGRGRRASVAQGVLVSPVEGGVVKLGKNGKVNSVERGGSRSKGA